MQYIELAGVKHPMVMSLAAAKALTEKFGGLDQMGKALAGEGGEDGGNSIIQTVDTLDTVLEILMKAGRVYAAAVGEELPPPLTCGPSELIDVRNNNAVQAILDTMTADADRTVKTVAKNGEATQGK